MLPPKRAATSTSSSSRARLRGGHARNHLLERPILHPDVRQRVVDARPRVHDCARGGAGDEHDGHALGERPGDGGEGRELADAVGDHEAAGAAGGAGVAVGGVAGAELAGAAVPGGLLAWLPRGAEEE